MEGHIVWPEAVLRISKSVTPIGVTGPEEEEEEHEEEEEGEEGGSVGRLLSADWARFGRGGPTELMLLPLRPMTGDAYRFGVVVCGAIAPMDLYLEETSRVVALRIAGSITALFFSDRCRGALAIFSGFTVLCRNAVATESLAGKSIGGIET